MKTTFEQRLQSAAYNPNIDTACAWLHSYVEQSWSLAPQYKSVAWVIPHLKPLMALVPYVPADKILYRVVGTDETKTVGSFEMLPANELLSFTHGVGKSHWISLADQIGADNFDNLYVLQLAGSAYELFNCDWLFKVVLPTLKKLGIYQKGVRLLEESKGYVWQKEVVVYSSSPIRVKVIAKLA